ncbi:MAG: hypothetical protein ACYTG7_12965 [Planctomycetota bacterium]|jgi:hypothetical protein
MKRWWMIACSVWLFCFLGNMQAASGGDGDNRALGDVLWTLDLSGVIEGQGQGVEFDGTNFWVTSPGSFMKAYLYEIDQAGSLVNQYTQPSANWGFWGWRDLGFDGTNLYAGDDSHMPGYITQIDPSNGQITGVHYGAYPVIPCRAMAYVTIQDCFWSATFSSDMVQCFKDGTYNLHINPGFTFRCAATEESIPEYPRIWWCCVDGSGATAVEYDPIGGIFTGKSFDLPMSASPIGACAYDQGGGQWVLVTIDTGNLLVAYDLDTAVPLKSSVGEVSCWFGGEVTFFLDAGSLNKHRYFGVLASLSGSSPGTVLPGGKILPINWDWFTTLLMTMAFMGSPNVPFFDNLDGDGKAEVVLTVPPHLPVYYDLEATFAYCLNNPFDYVSNPVEVLLLGKP